MMPFDRTLPYNDLPDLPPDESFLSMPIQQALTRAARALGELNGLCASIPDPHLLINTVVLQESRDSSAIENIVTTQDELYQATADQHTDNAAVREVLSYREALYAGFERMKIQHNLLTTNTFVEIVNTIKQNRSGIRTVPGTALRNAVTGEVVYTPPDGEAVIRQKLATLETFINDDEATPLDPLIKLALMHYQFEAIHPFSDGNGRTGRILNGLYLVQQGLLTHPVLYLSRYIVEYKNEYYQRLRGVTEQANWHDWTLYILNAVAETAHFTARQIREILSLKLSLETEVRQVTGAVTSSELVRLMLSQPYLKIELLTREGLAHRQTAALYLRKLTDADILRPQKRGRATYYINHRLMALLTNP